MPNDRKTLKGRVNVFLRDARTGNIVDERHIDNLVVDAGEAWVANRMVSGMTTAGMDYIELGLGPTTPTSANLILNTFLPSSRKVSSGNSSSGATWEIIVNWTTSEANTSNIVEAGIFNTSTDNTGTLLAHTVFTAVNKTNNDTLQIQWQINVSDDQV